MKNHEKKEGRNNKNSFHVREQAQKHKNELLLLSRNTISLKETKFNNVAIDIWGSRKDETNRNVIFLIEKYNYIKM